MKEIVLATNNQGKVDEFNQMFADNPIHFLPQSQFSIEPVAETGLTFVENAILKARHASQLTGLPALGDDSGLVVDALNGEPGVHTARYAGEQGNHEKNIAKLIEELDGLPLEKRTAQVHCVLAFLLHPKDPAPLICSGVLHCQIALEPVGEKGFGYDPVLYLPDRRCTLAEVDRSVKNTISHRAKAVEKFKSTIFV